MSLNVGLQDWLIIFPGNQFLGFLDSKMTNKWIIIVLSDYLSFENLK